jgi:membrane-associated protease RseP (regulator of RpoE activity)
MIQICYSPVKNITFLGFILLLAGCNPYSKYYHGETDAAQSASYIPSNKPIQIIQTNDIDLESRQLMTKGYDRIGYSSFTGPSGAFNETQIRSQAKKIGAQIVAFASNYSHTISGAVPISMPQSSTTFSSGSASVYGLGNPITAYGSGTTTTYGTSTALMPYSVAKYNYIAAFFAATKLRLGIFTSPLSDELKKKIQSNFGVMVVAVAEGSPAFMANILPGDIVISFNGTQIQSPEHLPQLVTAYSGTTANVVIYRNGRAVSKRIPVLKI